MQTRIHLLAVLLLLNPLAVIGAEEIEKRAQPVYRFIDLFVWLLPMLMLGVMLWWYVGRSAKRQRRYMEQAEQHQIKIEQALDRIATALERKDKDAA